MNDRPHAFVCSCPRCGEPLVISRVTMTRAVPGLPISCVRCREPSPLWEWVVRVVRPLSAFRDVTGF